MISCHYHFFAVWVTASCFTSCPAAFAAPVSTLSQTIISDSDEQSVESEEGSPLANTSSSNSVNSSSPSSDTHSASKQINDQIEKIFQQALTSTGDAYLNAEASLLKEGANAIPTLSQHLTDTDLIARLVAAALIPWIEGKAPENDKILDYLEQLPIEVRKTPERIPRIDGVSWFLGRYKGQNLANLMTLRLLKLPDLPRWRIMAVLNYLRKHKSPDVAAAIQYFSDQTQDTEQRECALDLLKKRTMSSI